MDEGTEMLEDFNTGYLIEKHRLALAKKLVSSVTGEETPFMEDFVTGSQEDAKERTQFF